MTKEEMRNRIRQILSKAADDILDAVEQDRNAVLGAISAAINGSMQPKTSNGEPVREESEGRVYTWPKMVRPDPGLRTKVGRAAAAVEPLLTKRKEKSARQLAEKTGHAQRDVSDALRLLVKRGVAKKIGGGRGTTYRLK